MGKFADVRQLLADGALHELLGGLAVPVCVVRDDELMAVVAYTRRWGELLGWGDDDFVGSPALDIGFLPDYIGGSTPENVALLRERLEMLAETSGFTRPVQRRDGSDFSFEGMVFAWHVEGDARHFVFIEQLQLQISSAEVLRRAEDIVDVLPFNPGAPETDDASTDTSDTRARLTVRVDRAAADEVGRLAREEGVTLNALTQAALEGVAAAHNITERDVQAGSVGFIIAAAKAMACREVKRARYIDYQRRNTRSV